MKFPRLISIAWLALLSALSSPLSAPLRAQQPRNVQASQAAATRDQITADLKFGSGRTLSLLSGGTLSLAGSVGGTPTGGTLDLSALTLTLPASSLSALNADNLTSGTVPDARLASGITRDAEFDTVAERTALGIKSTTGGSPEEIEDKGNLGASTTFNLGSYNAFRGILNADLTPTFSGFTSGKLCSGSIYLTQDATGSRAVNWPAAMVSTITINPTANSLTRVDFLSWDGGTSIFGWSDYSTASTGDFSSNTSSSVDNEIVLFSGTGGKTGKRATASGIAKITSGVLSAITPGTGVETALAVNVGSSGAFVTFGGAGGTPSSLTLTNATGLPIGSGLTGAGSGVLTALGVNVGSAGAFVVNGGALGTPSSGTLTNATGLPISGLVDSTSAALGLGQINLGHASDTQVYRASAGMVAINSQTVATDTNTLTLTNKTLDATGNVLKFKKHYDLAFPELADGTGATVGTTATALGYGRATFSNSADEAANYVEFYLFVPDDIDTSVALRARVKIVLGGTDTGTHRYVLSSVSVADSAVVTSSTLANAINFDFAGDGSGASGDVETSAWTTLTSWNSALTAGQTWRIRVARDGNATEDASTVNSILLGVVIEYGATQ